MSFRKPFSKVREKVKRELSKIGDKLGREGPDVGDKGFDRSALSLQSGPVSIVVEGGARGEDNSVPRSVVEKGHDLGETSQGNPHPLPHMEVESVSGQEGGDRANSPRSDVGNRTPIPFISSQDGESEGM